MMITTDLLLLEWQCGAGRETVSVNTTQTTIWRHGSTSVQTQFIQSSSL